MIKDDIICMYEEGMNIEEIADFLEVEEIADFLEVDDTYVFDILDENEML